MVPLENGGKITFSVCRTMPIAFLCPPSFAPIEKPGEPNTIRRNGKLIRLISCHR